ncbi:hypothetical protein [Streptomyces sp. NBC_01304]|uniref:hypothetical protein n=1 Tax=Streptomyces sp. NBC_01304 TaxID=2903818 RepID=UPI002E0E4D72|nr:hypothetical protein OG430_33695 [Streptomyces sp. NBC_01304]
MYVVTIDTEHGVVAAPRSEADRDEATEASLLAHGFGWNNHIEAYVHQSATGRETAIHTYALLSELRHAVITAFGPGGRQP